MRRLLRKLLLAIVLISSALVSTSTLGELEVEILDHSPGGFFLEPVYVTFAVRNTGASPVVIPAGDCLGEGAFLRFAKVGLDVKESNGLGCSHRVVLLNQGERWLFYQVIQLPDGVFEVEALVRSPGECRGRPIGPNNKMLEPNRTLFSGRPVYDCWTGEAKSQVVRIEVGRPTGEADVAAAHFLVGRDYLSSGNPLKKWSELWKKYPTSHYTYAAFQLAGGGRMMINVVRSQPENPLNPWVVAAIAEDLAKDGRPCHSPRPKHPSPPPQLDEWYSSAINTYEPPEPVSDYLSQLRLEHSLLTCGSPGE